MNPPQPDTIHFEILPATEQDSSTLASIESTANDEANKARLSQNLSRVLFGPPCKTTQDFRAKDLTEKMQTDKSARFWKAVISHGEDKGKVVAWTQWYFYTEPQDIEWEEIEWPAPVNAKAANEVIGDGFAVRKGYMSGKRFAYLQALATLPEYRCKGIGSALIRRGLDEASALGLGEAWLESSEDGHDLYETFGFRDVEQVVVDLGKYGGEGQCRIIAMRKVCD